MSVVTTAIDEKTGEEKKRLINKSRWKGYGPTTISFSDKSVRSVVYTTSLCMQLTLHIGHIRCQMDPHRMSQKRRIQLTRNYMKR